MVHLINPDAIEPQTNYSDVTVDNFARDVIEKSNDIPVLIDFWAPWCEPCKSLTPVLEGLADEYQGDLYLAKINVDEQQELAMQFSVRNIPTVYLVKEGRVIDGFTGAQPKKAIETMLSQHINRSAPAKPDDPIQNLIDEGDIESAIEQLANDDSEDSQLQLTRLYLQQNELDKARDTLAKVTDQNNSQQYRSAKATLLFSEIVDDSEQESELRERIANDASDWDAHHKLAAIHLLNENHQAGLELLLQIVKNDRSFNNDAGRLGLIAAFDLIGSADELVGKYRSLLANLLN